MKCILLSCRAGRFYRPLLARGIFALSTTEQAITAQMIRALRVVRAPRLLARPAVRAYHENIIDHYESPRNVGSLDKNDPSVGTGLVGAPACGDVMKLQMSIKDGKVENAVFKVSIRSLSRPAVATPAPAAASKTHRTARTARTAALSARRRLGAARRSRARRTRPSG